MVDFSVGESKGDILVVDDNPTNLQLLSQILLQEGYSVRCVRETSLVLPGIKAFPPDLILMDIVMPEMNGYEVCRQIKKDTQISSIPILFISAYNDIDSKITAFEAGGVDFITKPFQSREVIERVKTHITLFRQQHELEQHRSNLETLVMERTREVSEVNQKLLWEINERMRAEIELQDLQRYHKLIIESAGEGICSLDEKGNIVLINSAGAEILGWNQADLIGMTLYRFTQNIGDEDPLTTCALCRSISDGVRHQGENQLLRHKTGRYIPIEFSSTPILDEGQHIIGAVIVFQEISDRKQRDRQREATISIASVLRTASSIHELASELLSRLAHFTTMQGGAIILQEESCDAMVIESASGILAASQGTHFPHQIGFTTRLLENGKPITIENSHQDAFLAQILPGESNCPAIAVPFITQTEMTGFMLICSPIEIIEEDFSILSAIADMTASSLKRIFLHEQTEKRLQQLAALQAIDQAILHNFDIRLTVKRVLEYVISLLRVDNAIMLLFDTKNDCFEYLDGQGLHLSKKPQKFISTREHIASTVIETKNTIELSLQQTEKNLWLKHYVQDDGLQAYLALPLIARDKIIGVLEIYHQSPIELSDEDRNFLNSLAGQGAIALDNIILFESMREANIHLKQSYDTTIEGWARALELRDQETEGHTRRVSQLTVLLSREIGLDEEQIEHARIGAVLHDVGKMGIPDSILLKPGKLTPEEWDIIKRHTIYGYEMLLPIEFLSSGLDVVYYHHEKWDGSGYPTGKKGEDIPLPARIFCIVDVWDALTSERPYKKAWSKQEALDYIQQEIGKQFDPRVAEAFLRIIRTENEKDEYENK